MKKYLIIFCLFLTFTTCKKKVLEIVPVLQIEQDISINTSQAIKYFSFPSSQVGFAGGDDTIIYKTINGGSAWSEISVGTYGNCMGVEFFDDLHGMCLRGRELHTTADGGNTWKAVDTQVDFIGISSKGIGVYLKCYYGSTDVYLSSDTAKTFDFKETINKFDIADFTSARITDNKIIFFNSDTFYDDIAYGYDIDSLKATSIKFDNLGYTPADIYLSGGTGFVVAAASILTPSEYGFGYTTTYDGYYAYNSIDGYNGFIVCVGDKTIVSNLDIQNKSKWNEVFDTKGNGFDKTFYKIRFFDNHTFYLSGTNGYLIKAKI